MMAGASEELSKALQLLQRGDSLFVDEDFTEAVNAYASCSNILSLLSTSKNKDKIPSSSSLWTIMLSAYSHLSAANLKLKKYENALNDANGGLEIHKNGKLEENMISINHDKYANKQIEMCYMRAGIASFELKKFKDAVKAFKEAKEISSSKDLENYNEWIEKSEKSLSNSIVRSKAVQPPSVPTYQYHQSENVMTISILESGVKSQNLTVDLSLDKLTVILKKQGKDLTVMHGTLYDAIDVPKCKVKYMDEKVLIKLRKKDAYNWNELFGNGARSSTAIKDDNDDKTKEKEVVKKVETTNKPKAGLVNPYASTKDWNAIDRDLRKEEENETPEGDAALNKLFQNIYGNADPEKKRAMVKSFQTSGGTVLSTNWDEVSKTNYEKERQAPKGMEWKNWEGEKLPQKDND